MAGTFKGGRKAAATNKQRYGEDFFRTIGKKGGEISHGGGFTYNHELAVSAGTKGGIISAEKRARSVRETGYDPILRRQSRLDTPTGQPDQE